MGNVDDKFQEAQNLGPKITTTGYCPGKGYDLAHVLSWHNIAEPFLRTPFGYFEMMKRGSDDAKIAVEFMVDQLFEIDEDAYAPILKVKDGGDDDGNGEIVKSFEWEKHATLLRNGKLGKMNEEMRQKAKNVFNRNGNREEKYYDKIAMMNLQKTKTWTCTTRSVDDQSQFYKENCEDMKEFFKILNSAPANLRYGCSTVNRGIGDATDPMGMDPFHPSCKNCNTEKEKRWMTGMLVPNAKNLMIVLPSQCSHPNRT